LFLARQLPSAATALLLITGASLVSAFAALDSQAQVPDNCEEAAELAVLTSPIAPWKGAPLRVMFVTERPLEGDFSLIAPNGKVAVKSHERHGGPPYFWFAELESPAGGTWQAELTPADTSAGCSTITHKISVRQGRPPRPTQIRGSVWPLRSTWDRATEDLYSVWIEKLFDAPLDAELSWPALHEVLRDPSRNFLFNHLGLGEDQKGLIVRPDCADLPYFLRAYFAFKMGLPFGYSKCSRGGGGPPKCYEWWNIQNEEPPPAPPEQEVASSGGNLFGMFGEPTVTLAPRLPPRPQGLVSGFGYYVGTTLANAVQSGNGRAPANDDNTDYYPVALKQETLRPGTIYADPYGHVLMLVKRVPQLGDAAGVLLAVDAQPDGTVARKRFWRGNFLFAQDPTLGSPGFKRFRPIVREKNGVLRRLTNNEITKNPQYADFSLDQSRLGIEDFYDRMDDVISPAPLDPVRAMKEAITALEEQVKARVTSVENGRKYQIGGGGNVDMPDGASIFETSGAWEDYATPSRDLRLLIAMDVVRGFPDRVARRPDRYAMPEKKSIAEVKTELMNVLASELSARKFSYTRSDGSAWTLALKDVLDRAADLEMAYNLNDCVELRWGAPEESEEASTCKRHASSAQRAKMMEYRTWFHERRRPPSA
jgi:hypothetical protein